jgi:hypothetical protein
MASQNTLLLFSTALCTLFHAVFFCAIPGLSSWKTNVIAGLGTALIRHSVAHPWFVLGHRFSMGIVLAYDFLMCRDLPICFHLVLGATFLFVFGYDLEFNALITMTHIQMLVSLSSK